jgi:hypothetical protein
VQLHILGRAANSGLPEFDYCGPSRQQPTWMRTRNLVQLHRDSGFDASHHPGMTKG